MNIRISYGLCALVLIVLSSCNLTSKKNRDQGQMIVTEKTKKWSLKKPYGMVLVPAGSFVVGQQDYDFTEANSAPSRTVSVSSFYMDETDVTNAIYRKFVYWVRDSIARTMLAERAAQSGVVNSDQASSGSAGALSDYAYLSNSDDNADKPYYQYVSKNTTGREGGYNDAKKLNWNVDLVWDVEQYPDLAYAEVLEELYYPPDERINGLRALDTRKLNYTHTTVDVRSAARKGIRKDLLKKEVVNIYPDTAVWARDFNYSYNEPMHTEYFWHQSYSNYPVVGVNWHQARAFCVWRTQYHRSKVKNPSNVFEYRLPTEFEWEYAARGGLSNATYPWGGPYLIDDRGCFLANFKPGRGNYIEDCGGRGGWMYTSKVKSFPANGYGLYDMAGNVADWTNSPYDNSAYQIVSSMNPNIDEKATNKRVIRGGSWKDIGYFLQVGVRDWEYSDSARSYIGFRTVQTIPPRAKK